MQEAWGSNLHISTSQKNNSKILAQESRSVQQQSTAAGALYTSSDPASTPRKPRRRPAQAGTRMARSELTRKNGFHLSFATLAVPSASGPGRPGAESGWRDSCRRCRRQPGLRVEGLSRRGYRAAVAPRGQLDIGMRLFGAAAQDRAAADARRGARRRNRAGRAGADACGGAGRWRLAGAPVQPPISRIIDPARDYVRFETDPPEATDLVIRDLGEDLLLRFRVRRQSRRLHRPDDRVRARPRR
jgi:hypothetical protein